MIFLAICFSLIGLRIVVSRILPLRLISASTYSLTGILLFIGLGLEFDHFYDPWLSVLILNVFYFFFLVGELAGKKIKINTKRFAALGEWALRRPIWRDALLVIFIVYIVIPFLQILFSGVSLRELLINTWTTSGVAERSQSLVAHLSGQSASANLLKSVLPQLTGVWYLSIGIALVYFRKLSFAGLVFYAFVQLLISTGTRSGVMIALGLVVTLWIRIKRRRSIAVIVILVLIGVGAFVAMDALLLGRGGMTAEGSLFDRVGRNMRADIAYGGLGLDFASAFKELGSGVVLLAGKRTDIRLQGDIDRQFPGFVLRTQHTGAYPRIVDVASLPRRAWRGLWKMWGREYYATRLSCGWAETMDNGQVFRELDRHAIRPDLIWGVSAGYLDGATAADNLARALGVPWILELHDPPRGCGLGPEWVAIRREFSRLLARSVRHVVTTDSYRRHLIEDFGLDAKCVQTVHGPFDGEIQAKVSFGGNVPWRIVYVGSLGGGRSLAPLVYGYCKALNRQPCIKGNSRIEIAGTGPGAVETRALARVLGIGATVRIHGAVPKERADELVRLSSVSVVVQSEETSAFQIPGKVFQYMSSGNPILAIMPECEAAAILRRSGLGFVHPQGDIDGIADTLVRLWTDWRAGRSSVEMDRDYVRQFSSKNLPEKLRLVLEGLL